jgi:O-antigen ligase
VTTRSTAPSPLGGSSVGSRVADLGAATITFLTVALVARNDGGWWSTTRSGAALALLFVATAAVILQPSLPLDRLDLAFLGVLGALTLWTGLSALWASSPPESVLEFERTTAYLGGMAALLLVARRRSLAAGLAGVLAALVLICCHALSTRFVPDHVTSAGSSVGFRLAGVLGYPNALGIFAVLGLLLALGFLAECRYRTGRALAAASVVPATLALYLANSRGSWIALAVGTLLFLTLVPRPKEVGRACLPPAAFALLAVWLVSRSNPVTRWEDPAAAVADGHRLAVVTLALAVASGLLALDRSRLTLAGAVVATVVALLVAPSSFASVAVVAGGAVPVPGAPAPGETPSSRLFSTASNSRTEYWRVAAIDFLHHPVIGSGAGTFVREWYRHRRIRVDVQDAHSLYLETLAELGVVGLGLLAAVFAMPVLAARRARGTPLVPGAFAAFGAFAAHAAIDWDWELPAVTFAGLFCGALLVVAARREPPVLAGLTGVRAPLIVPLMALLVFSFVGVVGNRAEAKAVNAAWRSDWETTDIQARRAQAWAPWSAQALILRALVARARHDPTAARSLLLRAAEKDPGDYAIWRRVAAATSGKQSAEASRRARVLNPLG